MVRSNISTPSAAASRVTAKEGRKRTTLGPAGEREEPVVLERLDYVLRGHLAFDAYEQAVAAHGADERDVSALYFGADEGAELFGVGRRGFRS